MGKTSFATCPSGRATADVWRAYKAPPPEGGKVADRNDLAGCYGPLVGFLAGKLGGRLPQFVELDDLVQWGTLGLIEEIGRYDLSRGVGFPAFATARVRGAMLDGLREYDWAPRLTRSRSRTYNEAAEGLACWMGRKPTPDEVQSHLGLPDKAFKLLLAEATAVPEVMSLAKTCSRKADPNAIYRVDAEIGYAIDDRKSPPPGDRFTDAEEASRCMAGLSRAEKLILQLYYGQGMTMREIGRVLDLSESRVSQVHADLMQELKARRQRPVASIPAAAASPVAAVKAKQGARPGERHYFAKLTAGQVFDIRRDPRPRKDKAAAYGVSVCTIRKIENGEKWKYIA